MPSPGEQSLSDDDLPPAPSVRRKKKKAPEPPPKAMRPVWFRYLTWVLMIGFTLAAIVELRAQYYRNHNLRVAHEALDRGEGGPQKVTYDEIKDRFWSTPESSTGQSEFVSNVIYTWSWHGLRKYVVRLYVSPKDGQLRKVESQP
ncbi:MAG TPA: hypothetical protein VFG04_26420 [Planctomycetaceae bacterium]|nr:hypothetical protein [Planctomycetaceae bacterium]